MSVFLFAAAGVVIPALVLLWAMCHIAAPATQAEQDADDAEQIKYLNEQAAKR